MVADSVVVGGMVDWKYRKDWKAPGEVRNWVDFVVHVENTLGWLPPEKYTVWRARHIEAAKVKRKAAQKPQLYTLTNLLVTVEWLRRRRQTVKSPVAVCWFVEQALDEAYIEEEPEELETRINAAVATEMARPRPVSQQWIDRLNRARGAARAEVLAEWEKAGDRGPSLPPYPPDL